MAGRYAPSPTGELHLGNLRTALAAWLLARSSGRRMLVRMEDLDRVAASVDHERAQLRDLAALGLHADGEVVRQSERFDRYHAALATLRSDDLVYPCYCTRREIAAEIAASVNAPHGSTRTDRSVLVADGAYPGTCRTLTREQRHRRASGGRSPAWRLRAGDAVVEVTDERLGRARGLVDDFVVQRNDGVPAYNLAVVVDDAAQGVTQVVRGDDLWSSTPRQVLLHRLLGSQVPQYVHVPLVVGDDGQRLAKRHGAVTLTDLAAHGYEPSHVLVVLAASLGLPVPGGASTAADLSGVADAASLVSSIPDGPVPVAELFGHLERLQRSPR